MNRIYYRIFNCKHYATDPSDQHSVGYRHKTLLLSGFRHGVVEILAPLDYRTMLTFQDSVLVPSSMVQIWRWHVSWNISNKPTYAAQQPKRVKISIVLEFYVCNVNKPISTYIRQVSYMYSVSLFTNIRHEKHINDPATDLQKSSVKILHSQILMLIFSYFIFKTLCNPNNVEISLNYK